MSADPQSDENAKLIRHERDDSQEIPPITKDWIELQKFDLENRRIALENDKDLIDAQSRDLALSVDASLKDRADERLSKRHTTDRIFQGAVGICVIVAAVAIVAVIYDKQEVALEIVKMVGAVTIGAIGGYGLGKGQSKADSEGSPNE